MNKYTKSIDEVIHYLSKLPSIGRKSATKMALTKSPLKNY